jgi:tetratricopeptide repeat protein
MGFKFSIGILLVAILLECCKQTNDDLINRGVALAKQKKYKDAIKLYTRVINRNDKIQLAYYDRGFSFMGLKIYALALRDFNKVLSLQTVGDFVYTENPNTPFSSDEARGQVPYNDALYQRARVKFYMDSLRSSFEDFQTLVNSDYEKSNCLTWQGTIWIRGGDKNKACEYFERAKQAASTEEDKQEANEFIKTYCQDKNNR